jgi:hypothetical protein
VSNPRPASLCCAVRGHICKFYIYYNNYTIIWKGKYTVVISTRAAREPAHNNGCGPWQKRLDTHDIKQTVLIGSVTWSEKYLISFCALDEGLPVWCEQWCSMGKGRVVRSPRLAWSKWRWNEYFKFKNLIFSPQQTLHSWSKWKEIQWLIIIN